MQDWAPELNDSFQLGHACWNLWFPVLSAMTVKLQREKFVDTAVSNDVYEEQSNI